MVCYADGSRFDGEPQDAPVNGVLGIVQKGKKRPKLYNEDYYYFLRGQWWGTKNPAAALEKHRDGCPLIHGFDIDDEAWAAFLDWFLHE